MQSYFSRTRKAAPPVLDAEGNPAATIPPRTWRRLSISYSSVPPKVGQLISYDQGPFTRRFTVYAPVAVMTLAFTALLGQMPWIRELVMWLVRHAPTGGGN